MNKIVKFHFYISTGYSNSSKEEIVEIELPADYNIRLDPKEIINEHYFEWVSNNAELSYSPVGENN